MTLQDTISRPEIRSLGDYNPPSRSAQELYGDDMLVHAWWKGNQWFVSAATFRAPRAMSFGDFWAGLLVPLLEGDPDFDAGKGWEQFTWFLAVARNEVPVEVDPARSLTDLGVTHKAVLGFKAH